MLSLLLAADALAKLGAAIGASLAAIGAGIGIVVLVARLWTLWLASQRRWAISVLL